MSYVKSGSSIPQAVITQNLDSAVAEFEQFLALKMQREEIDQKFEELTKSNLGSNKGDTRVNPGSPEGNE